MFLLVVKAKYFQWGNRHMEKDSKQNAFKQMLQRLPIALAQVKSGNTSENLLNEIHQIIYSLYGAKETTKKVCNSIMDSIKL